MKPHENLLKKVLFVLQGIALAFCFSPFFAPSAHSSPNLNQAAKEEAALLGITIPKSISTLNGQKEEEKKEVQKVPSEQKAAEPSKAAGSGHPELRDTPASSSSTAAPAAAPVSAHEEKEMENQAVKLKNSATSPAATARTAEKLSSSPSEPSPAPPRQPDEEKKAPTPLPVEKNAVSSDAKIQPSVTVPAETAPVKENENPAPSTEGTSPSHAGQSVEEKPTSSNFPVEKEVSAAGEKEAISTIPVSSAPKVESAPPSIAPPTTPAPGLSQQPAKSDTPEPEKNTPKKTVSIIEFSGTWKGHFINAYGKTAATLTVKEREAKPYCVFTFYPLPENPGAGSGQFEMSVSLNEGRGDCELRGVRWIKNPKRRGLMHLRGKLSGNKFSGKIFADIPTPDDWTFKLEKKVR